MSVEGMKAAKEYATKLKCFNSQEEAEEYFEEYIYTVLEMFLELSEQFASVFKPDFSVESLKSLEKLYFTLFENDLFDEKGLHRSLFERMIEVYWGQVVVLNNEKANFVVNEFPFVENAYNLCINAGYCTMNCYGLFNNLWKKPDNKRHNYMYRKFKKYFDG